MSSGLDDKTAESRYINPSNIYQTHFVSEEKRRRKAKKRMGRKFLELLSQKTVIDSFETGSDGGKSLERSLNWNSMSGEKLRVVHEVRRAGYSPVKMDEPVCVCVYCTNTSADSKPESRRTNGKMGAVKHAVTYSIGTSGIFTAIFSPTYPQIHCRSCKHLLTV